MTIRTTLAAAAALALAGVGLVAGTTAAAAHDASASLDCEGWTASASAYPADAHGLVIADGVTIHDGTFGGAGTLEGAWPAEADSHRLQVTITSTDGWPDYVVDETVDGCAPVVDPPAEPEPETPLVDPQVQTFIGECDAAFVLDNVGGAVPVYWTINGAHTYLVPAGEVVHTDADGTRIEPVDGEYQLLAHLTQRPLEAVVGYWTFPAGDCIAPQPEPETASSTSEWRDTGVIECGDTTVEQTRLVTVTSTSYDLVDGQWVLGTPIVVSESTERQQRDLAADEVIACPLPPVETSTPAQPAVDLDVPVAPAPVVDAPAVGDAAPETLPETGGTPAGWLVMLAIGIAAAGVVVRTAVRS